jgi:hypothetical protein
MNTVTIKHPSDSAVARINALGVTLKMTKPGIYKATLINGVTTDMIIKAWLNN